MDAKTLRTPQRARCELHLDPVPVGDDELFSALSDRGRVPGSFFFETKGVPLGRRSLLLPAPALRLTLQGDTVTIVPLSASGARLLPSLATGLQTPFEADGLRLRVPVPSRDLSQLSTDSERLAAPSSLDLLRELPAAFGALPGMESLPIAGAFSFEFYDHFEDVHPPTGATEPLFDLVVAFEGIEIDSVDGSLRLFAFEHPALPAASERIDSLKRAIHAVEAPTPGPSIPAPTAFEFDLGASDFLAGGEELLAAIRRGEIFQTVLSRRLRVESAADPSAVFQRLRRDDPALHHFLFNGASGVLFGASPETYLRVDGDRAELLPIAGTRPRGRDHDEDSRLAAELALDAKETAEHAMLVDLARNDLARVARPGTRRLEECFVLRRYPAIFHLVSRVTAELRPECDALEVLAAVYGMGTLTGAPKRAAIDALRRLEPTPRSFYGGAVGVLEGSRRFESAIAIRCALHNEGVFDLRAGAGFVAASDPHRERFEIDTKLRPLLSALDCEDFALLGDR